MSDVRDVTDLYREFGDDPLEHGALCAARRILAEIPYGARI